MPDIAARIGRSLLGTICLFLSACGSDTEQTTVVEPATSEKSWLKDEGAFTYTHGTRIFMPTAEEAEAIKGTIKDFLRARSAQELAPLILEPERVLPKVEEYYQSNSFISGGVSVNPEFRTAGKYIVTKLTLDGGSPPKLLALEKTAAGYKVNWEIFSMESPSL